MLFVKILPIYALFLNENLSKCALSAGTLGMHTSFGDYLTVKMCEFLKELDILQEYRSALPRGHCVLVIDDRRTCSVCQFLLHFFFLK